MECHLEMHIPNMDRKEVVDLAYCNMGWSKCCLKYNFKIKN